ncbi:MAG: hypothetical protein WC719_01345 [Patescibacteria group bacterium]|jgi:hypothetical protein
MYNKISSIILNSAKAVGLSDVFVAQPDTLKENQAGKIFVLGEIGGKKTEGQKVFDFLVMALNDNYYNDEKILFKDKIPGLKIENIFEAAVTKTNRDLADFLVSERVRLNPAATNLTIGVVYENKIHFANFGHNRALLVFRRGDEYEIINVEANAAEALAGESDAEAAPSRAPKLFSSVISGEIPFSSYFVLSNEALPEYLSNKEMISIVTKLPPLAAAEQIKNVLAKVNTYIPFLGIIIKNTVGLAAPDAKEDLEESSAHSSISSLNYTEQKTERMLAPAGLINLSGMVKGAQNAFKDWRAKSARPQKKYIHQEEDRTVQPPLDLGSIKSMSMAGVGSFSGPDKVYSKKRSGAVVSGFKNIGSALAGLFSGHIWSAIGRFFKSRLMSLNKKNRLLFAVLGVAVVVLAISIITTNLNHNRATEEANFNGLITAINDKENEIAAHLLYDDETGATGILVEAQNLLASLPQDSDSHKAAYQELSVKLAADAEKLQKIVRVASADKINDLIGLGINNLAFVAGKIYAAGGATVYALTPNSSSSTKIDIKGATNLANPHKDYHKDLIHYWDAGNIAELIFKTKANSLISTAKLDAASSLVSFKIYNGKLYSIAKDKNQIYSYVNNKGFSAKTDWLKDSADLSQAIDLGIDGDIYVLKVDGSILKFTKGKTVEYGATAISPIMTSANKLIVGTNYLYVFEAASKRLAVLSKKTGSLVNQYIIDSLGSAKDVTVDESGKAAYFLDGDAVYKIGLK